MSEQLNTDDINYESFESRVIITFPAVLKRPLGYERGSADEQTRHGETERYFETHDDLVFEERLGNNILSIDAKFDPDYTYDHPQQIEQGEIKVTRIGPPEFRFELYASEVIAAARHRAIEDSTDPSCVLAEWLYRAVSSSNVTQTDAGQFYTALSQYVHDYTVDAEWRVEYGGGGDEQRIEPERQSPQTLEEARIYLNNDGDMEAVADHREDDQ